MKNRLPFTLVGALIALGVTAETYGQSNLVVPSEFATIQSAIDAASSGDTVTVEDGTYIENIDFMGKAIILGSRFLIDGDTTHIRNTVIDGSEPASEDSASTVSFVSGEDSTSALVGLTLTGGTGTVISTGARLGGGIICLNSAPRLANLRVVDNRIESGPVQVGGGIGCVNEGQLQFLEISSVVVSGNSVGGTEYGGGGGFFSEGYDLVLRDSEIRGNTVSGSATVEGGGVWASGLDGQPAVVEIVGTSFVENVAETESQTTPSGGGGLVVGAATIRVTDNIFSENEASVTQGGGGGVALLIDPNSEALNVFARNVVDANRCVGFNCIGGGVILISAADLSILDNRFTQNVSESVAGGIAVIDGEVTIQRNLIAGNTGSEAAGGVWLEHTVEQTAGRSTSLKQALAETDRLLEAWRRSGPDTDPAPSHTGKTASRNQVLVNNTIVGNQSMGLGPGIFTVLSSPQVLNSIVWGNLSSNPNQIAGGAAVSYSIVQGGYPGSGNQDADPAFADMTDYRLMPTSPAVDAGNPDTTYNDPEDNSNPGMALPPALGSVRNDLGAYGGPMMPVQSEIGFLGPQFAAFMERLDSVPFPDRAAIADSFFQSAGSLPFLEDGNVVYFIYRGNAGSVHVTGDFNGWQAGIHPMTQRSDVGFWYREEVFESDARLDYKYIRNGNDWILDPHNPSTIPGGFGANSELAMPGYVQPEEIVARPDVPRGATETIELQSSIMGGTRRASVHLPAEYADNPSKHYPVVFFHDGSDYMRFGSARTVIDNLIADGRVLPLIAVFVSPVDRNNEYAFTKTEQFERHIINEMMPLIDATYRTRSHPKARAMTGPSFGGLITTQICYNNPEVFGLCAPFSPSYWVDDGALMEKILNQEGADGKGQILKDIHWYLDWGTYEVGIATTGSIMAAGLEDLGYDVVANEWPEGHSWGSWRAHLDEFLELWFAPGAIVATDDETLPLTTALASVYPNPVFDRATISFELDQSKDVDLTVFDITGRSVDQILSQRMAAGEHNVSFQTRGMAAGVYLVRLRAEDFSETVKIIVTR